MRNCHNLFALRCGLLGVLVLSGRVLGFSDGLEPELPGIEVIEKRVGNAAVLSLHNPQRAEVTVSLEFTLNNLTPSVAVPLQVVLAPNSTIAPLITLKPTIPSKPWNYSYRDYFTWGFPLARHATNQLYRLPFAAGRCFRVVQGSNGEFSHTGQDRFAIDFDMPEGTPVLAARDGLVVLVRDGFDSGAPDPAYKKRANIIFVRHLDGTLGEYVHLLKGGMKVRVGDTVRTGQLLALSGNSGYTRGPHLHFMVFRAKDSKTRESVPIRFVAKEGSGLLLEEGKSYTASTNLDLPYPWLGK
jgi:murein DD-endopeptidase MepM/ murein hydrolase activator NlpD